MTRLASVLQARDVSPRRVPLSAFTASTVAAVRPYANRDGFLDVPSVERVETAWRYRVPDWFYRVPGMPACSWKRPDGTTLPRYPELIVRDLLVQGGGWNAAWAKNFGGRAFWVNLDRGGPELASARWRSPSATTEAQTASSICWSKSRA